MTERDFFALQRVEDGQWPVCAALSFLLHTGLAAMMLFMSSLFDARMPFEEAVIVSLAPPAFDRMPELGEISSAPEPAASTAPETAEPEPAETEPPARQEPQTREQPEPTPEPVREQPPPEPAPSPPPEPRTRPQPAPEPAAPPPPPAPAPEQAAAREPVSLAPAMKQQVAKDTRLEEERQEEEKKLARELEQRQKQADEKKRQEDAKKRQAEERELAKRLEQKQREADRRLREQRERAEQARQRAIAEGRSRQAAEEARRAEQAARRAEAEARAAREQLASMRGESRRTGATAGDPQAATGRTEGNPAIEGQYWRQVVQRLESYWKLPEGRSWGGGLEARVRITIGSDGQVTAIRFDRKSGDPFFDQLVEKTIRQAAPMPRFPAAMRQNSTQLPVRFNPGNLGRM